MLVAIQVAKGFTFSFWSCIGTSHVHTQNMMLSWLWQLEHDIAHQASDYLLILSIVRLWSSLLFIRQGATLFKRHLRPILGHHYSSSISVHYPSNMILDSSDRLASFANTIQRGSLQAIEKKSQIPQLLTSSPSPSFNASMFKKSSLISNHSLETTTGAPRWIPSQDEPNQCHFLPYLIPQHFTTFHTDSGTIVLSTPSLTSLVMTSPMDYPFLWQEVASFRSLIRLCSHCSTVSFYKIFNWQTSYIFYYRPIDLRPYIFTKIEL